MRKVKADPNRPQPAKVTGIVTHNGSAVEGAVVTFQTTGATPSAFGRTDAQGRYELTTYQSNDGAVLGQYRVSIMKMESPPETSVPEDDPNYSNTPPPRVAAKPKHLLTQKYANPTTSGLTAIVATGNNEISFDLK